MTGKELIEFIKGKGLEDYTVAVQFRDVGGCYDGIDHIDKIEVEEDTKTIIL